jgi:carbon-monoxide dehydrogenase large subunit
VGSLGAGVGLWESCKVRFSHTGKVQVLTGTHSHGQGHETTFSQVVASRLGVPFEDVEVIHGDTEKTPVGMGTYGSRSLAVGGEALAMCCDKIVAKGKKIAAHLMEAAEADVEFKDGKFTVAGTDKAVPIAQVAFTAYVPHNYPKGVEPGLRRPRSSTRRTSPTRRAPTSASSRSTRRPARSRSSGSSRSTTSATSSTR